MRVALSTEAPAEASGSVVAPTEAFESAVVPGVKLHAKACETCVTSMGKRPVNSLLQQEDHRKPMKMD